MSDKIIKKNQFQIRKVPAKRFSPLKSPQMYVLDIHSISIPNNKNGKMNWGSINWQMRKKEQQQYKQQIIYSEAYQQLYQKYIQIKQSCLKQKTLLQTDIQVVSQQIQLSNMQKTRLSLKRDSLYTQIQTFRQELTTCRNKNYNLRWQIYHQRGGYYGGDHYSFLEAEPTYEDYLMMEEQMGNVSKGLNQVELVLLPKQQYCPQQQSQPNAMQDHHLNNPENQKLYPKEICCICYDDINKGQFVTILKCNHIHHCQCIKDWLAKQKNCPICKKEVAIDDFHIKKPMLKELLAE